MEVHWKLDIKNNLYFTYCTLLKLETFGKKMETKFPVQNNFGLRKDVDFIFDSNIRRPALKFKHLICLNCEKDCIDAKFIKIKNDWIFDYYNKRRNIVKEDRDQPDRSEDEKDEINEYLSPKTQKKLVEDQWSGDLKLPLYFRKKYDINRFNKDKEILFFKDQKFRNYKESLVCIECYLKIVAHIQDKNKNPGTNIYQPTLNTKEKKQQKKELFSKRVDLMKEVLQKRKEDARQHREAKRQEDRHATISSQHEFMKSQDELSNFVSDYENNNKKVNSYLSSTKMSFTKTTARIESGSFKNNLNHKNKPLNTIKREASSRGLKGNQKSLKHEKVGLGRPKSSFKLTYNIPNKKKVKHLGSELIETDYEREDSKFWEDRHNKLKKQKNDNLKRKPIPKLVGLNIEDLHKTSSAFSNASREEEEVLAEAFVSREEIDDQVVEQEGDCEAYFDDYEEFEQIANDEDNSYDF